MKKHGTTFPLDVFGWAKYGENYGCSGFQTFQLRSATKGHGGKGPQALPRAFPTSPPLAPQRQAYGVKGLIIYYVIL